MRLCLTLVSALVLACNPALVEQDITPASRNIRLLGPAVLRGKQAGKIRTEALLTARISPNSVYARRYLDDAGHLAYQNQLPFLLRWQMLRPDGSPFPSGFFQSPPSTQIEPGGSATFHTTLSNLVPPGTYTLEIQFFHGGLPHQGNALTPVLRQDFDVYTPPVLRDSIKVQVHYAVEPTAFRAVDASTQVTADHSLIQADETHPARILVPIDQAQANSAYSLGYFTFNSLPSWVQRITFTSTASMKTNTFPLAPLTDNSEVTIGHTAVGTPVLDNILLPLHVGASDSVSQGLIRLRLHDRDGLSLPLNLLVSLHAA